MYTDDEEICLTRELKKKKEDPTMTYKLGIYLILAILCYIPAISSHYTDVEAWRWFPDTWRCKHCKYENYEGINTCAVCGTPR